MGEKAVLWVSQGSDTRKWSEEDQLLSHKARAAAASPSRAHGKMGGQMALPQKPEVDWMHVGGLLRLTL